MEKTLQYGKKYQVGNYLVLKFNKVLRRQEVEQLRDTMGIPKDERKKLQRAQLPYIKVMAESGIWAVEYCCNTSVYHMIDSLLAEGGEKNEAVLANIFNMWFMDTTVPGDEEYMRARSDALKGYIERIKASEVSDEDDAKVLEEMEAEERAGATIVDMTKTLEEGGSHE